MDGLITAFAVGGPRDGIKLSAGHDWNGRVEKPFHHESHATEGRKRYWPGYYTLTRRFDKETGVSYRIWRWIEDNTKAPKQAA